VSETASAAKILARMRREEAERRAAQPPPIRVTTTRYTVSELPETDINYKHAAVHVEYRGQRLGGGELWVVLNVGAQLHPDGEWREHDYYSWPDAATALDAAKAAIHTTWSVIASDALARSKELTR